MYAKLHTCMEFGLQHMSVRSMLWSGTFPGSRIAEFFARSRRIRAVDGKQPLTWSGCLPFVDGTKAHPHFGIFVECTRGFSQAVIRRAEHSGRRTQVSGHRLPFCFFGRYRNMVSFFSEIVRVQISPCAIFVINQQTRTWGLFSEHFMMYLVFLVFENCSFSICTCL